MNLTDEKMLEQVLRTRLSSDEIKKWLNSYATQYKELMAYYRCAMMEIETKFNVLNEELSVQYDRNPIETIKARLKSPMSILDKLAKKKLPITIENIENHLNDIAGVRVICSFPSDIYVLKDALLRQDDIRLMREKDYIKRPRKTDIAACI